MQVTNPLGKWQRYYYSPRGEQIATRGQTDYPVVYDFSYYKVITRQAYYCVSPTLDRKFGSWAPRNAG